MASECTTNSANVASFLERMSAEEIGTEFLDTWIVDFYLFAHDGQ
jgi:hypothetical protein